MKLVSLRAISNHALAGGELPNRLKLLNWGENESQIGPVRVTDATLRALQAQMAGKVFDRILVDFEHTSEPSSPTFQPAPRKHAGYGFLEVLSGDGVYLKGIEWTPAGREFAREYCDLSPCVRLNAQGEVTQLKSIALCPNGAVHELTFFSGHPSNEKGDTTMDWKEWLRLFSGAAEGASDEDVKGAFEGRLKALCAEAVAGVQAEVTALKGELTALSGAVPANAGETIATLSAQVGELKTATAGYAEEIAKRDRVELLAHASREGKVVTLSADSVAKMSLEDLTAHIEQTPVTVPMDQRTPDRIIALAAQADADGAVTRVARACGMDPAKVAGQK